VRVLTIDGELSDGAVGSSTTISVSGVAIGLSSEFPRAPVIHPKRMIR
jgi:hypothetical protein